MQAETLIDSRAVREAILLRARRSELTPSEAEREAESAGVGPLSFRADPAQFDPATKPFWTLAMVLAWVADRTFEAVREVDNEFRRECIRWTSAAFEGWENGDARLSYWLCQEHDVNAVEVLFGNQRTRAALDDLWLKLQRNELVCLARPALGGDRARVPYEQFYDLTLCGDPRGKHDTLNLKHECTREAYHDPIFASAEVLKVWSPISEGSASEETSLADLPGTSGFARLDYVPDQRDELIERARQGENPESLEAEAARLGIGPLERRPPVDDAELIAKPWTVFMALAWIMRRDLSSVIWWDNDYRTQCTLWKHTEFRLPGEPQRVGWLLEAPEAITWGLFSGGLSGFDADEVPKAKADLWKALRTGSVGSHGLPVGGAPRRALDKLEWIDLDYVCAGGGERAQWAMANNPTWAAYLDVRFAAQEIRSFWASGQEREGATKTKPRKRLSEAELTRQFWAWHKNNDRPTRDEMIAFIGAQGFSREFAREWIKCVSSEQRRGNGEQRRATT